MLVEQPSACMTHPCMTCKLESERATVVAQPKPTRLQEQTNRTTASHLKHAVVAIEAVLTRRCQRARRVRPARNALNLRRRSHRAATATAAVAAAAAVAATTAAAGLERNGGENVGATDRSGGAILGSGFCTENPETWMSHGWV